MSSIYKSFIDFLPTEYKSICDYNNIIGIIDDYNILTKDENYCSIIKIAGKDLSSLSDDGIMNLYKVRKKMFSNLNSIFTVSIFAKREKEEKLKVRTIQNDIHVENILNKWNDNIKRLNKTTFYISLSTNKKSVLGFMNQVKDKLTKEKKEEDQNIQYLRVKLEEQIKYLLLNLEDYNPIRLTSKEVINFYASYMNMTNTKVNPKKGLLTDSYINSNVLFKKDYFIHENIDTKYSRFISVKAYEAERINSLLIDDILSIEENLLICQLFKSLNKDNSLSSLKRIKNRTNIEAVYHEIEELEGSIERDEESILNSVFTVLVSCESLKKLEVITKKIESIISNYDLLTVRETLNQKPMYFGFLPSKDNLLARKRKNTSSALAVLNEFNIEHKGFSKSEFGNEELCIFPTAKNNLYRFNYHISEAVKERGHTLVVAETNGGKTTLMSFLKFCAFAKYDINILALDKLNGMYNYINFFGGTYEDINEDFKLNPFSLENNKANKIFLENFLIKMGGIEKSDHQELMAIKETIEILYTAKEEDENQNFTLNDFINLLPEISYLKMRFNKYIGGYFDNENCSLTFENNLVGIAMDNILKDKESASLFSMYSNHKIKAVSQAQNGKNFIIFYDELKDYLHNKDMAQDIIEQTLEVRKLGGVICAAVQNIDFFNLIENKDAFLSSFATKIIFPTSSKKTIEKYEEEFKLNESDIHFLKTTTIKDRKVLLKVAEDSVILNIDLSPLEEYLKVFNSDKNVVKEVKKLKELYPSDWQVKFLESELK